MVQVEKTPTEVIDVAVDFSDRLASGETVGSPVAPAVAVLSGVDPSPDAVLSGAPAAVGASVRQRVVGGLAGVTYAVTLSTTTSAGHVLSKTAVLSVANAVGEKSLLFVKELAISRLRSGYVAAAVATHPFLANLSDDVLWLRLKSAEAGLQRRLGVPLAPTEIFSEEPDDAEITALAGKPYRVEPGYDMPPDYLSMSKWGALRLRQRPVVSIKGFRLVYPNQAGAAFTVPLDWIRIDRKYGQLIVSPSANSVTAPYSLFVMQALSSGLNVPYMIRVRYEAGLSNAHEAYPDVLDLCYRMAVASMLNSSFIGPSESVSADGFAQSKSFDMDKVMDAFKTEIGELKTLIIGPVWGVL